MPDYLEPRKNRWYATFTLPDDVKEIIGKSKILKSTGTSDKRKAKIIAAQYVAGWKVLVEQARGQDVSGLLEAIQFREDIEKSKDAEERETLEHALIDRLHRLAKDDSKVPPETFYDVAMGNNSPTSLHFDAWKSQLHQVQKSKDQMERDVKQFIKQFPFTCDIKHLAIRDWLEGLEANGATYSNRKRLRNHAKDFWKYLKLRKVITDTTDPFADVLPLAKRGKNNKSNEFLPFSPEDVVSLWHEAKRKKKDTLADLIALGAYTGARREELGSLMLKDIGETSFKIVDSKTSSGIREVPIHSAIAPLVNRLKKQSKDGYLLSGLPATKYGARSNALGQAFGRLKTSKGFGELHVFHSIRKTLVTLLENAGVSENLAADIVGHDKPRITYGLYSGGANIEVKRDALEKAAYPFQTLIY